MLAYFIVWFLIAIPLRRILRLHTFPLGVAIGFLIAVITLILLAGETALGRSVPRSVTTVFRLTWPKLLQLSLIVGCCLVADWGVYRVTLRRLGDQASQKRFLGILASMPIMSLLFVGLAYCHGQLMTGQPNWVTNSVWLVGTLIVLLIGYCLGRAVGVDRLKRWLYALGGIAVLAPVVAYSVGSQGVTPTAVGQRHKVAKVFLIIIDTLRQDGLSCYNPGAPTTPSMDGLAMDGIVFRNAYSSAPWTLPAVSSIMTGLTPSAHDTGMKQNVLPDGVPTLAEHFLKAGYVTAAVGVSEWLKSYSKLSRGFVEYNFLPPSLGLGIGDIFYRLFTTKTYDESHRGDNLTNTAVDWIRAQKNDDFFFWLHYVDPHAPYFPPEEFLRDGKPPSSMDSIIYVPPLELATGEVFLTRDQVEWLRRLYIGEVQYVDAQVGRFIDTLKQEKLYDQALIILTSDHGEEFLEHGSLDHGQNLYDELLKVPLIIKLPHSTVTASIDHPVSTMGLMRTILELCELESGANVDHLQSLVWSWNSKSGKVRALRESQLSPKE
jgi:hypothetical protein